MGFCVLSTWKTICALPLISSHLKYRTYQGESNMAELSKTIGFIGAGQMAEALARGAVIMQCTIVKPLTDL